MGANGHSRSHRGLGDFVLTFQPVVPARAEFAKNAHCAAKHRHTGFQLLTVTIAINSIGIGTML